MHRDDLDEIFRRLRDLERLVHDLRPSDRHSRGGRDGRDDGWRHRSADHCHDEHHHEHEHEHEHDHDHDHDDFDEKRVVDLIVRLVGERVEAIMDAKLEELVRVTEAAASADSGDPNKR